MKKIEKKSLTPDQLYEGDPVQWFNNITDTLNLLWSSIEHNKPRFYQVSYKFDRWVSEHKDQIRKFFDDRGVHVAVHDFEDPKVGRRSWMVLIAMQPRFSKYNSTCFFE